MSANKMITLTFPNYTDIPVKTYWRRSTLEKIPYFEALFRSGMIDSQQEEIIMEEDPQLFSLMMQHILGKDTRERLVTMADYYGVDIKVDKKREKIVKKKIPISVVIPAGETVGTITLPGYEYVNNFILYKPHRQFAMHNCIVSINDTNIDIDIFIATSYLSTLINIYSKGKEFELKITLNTPTLHELIFVGEMSVDQKDIQISY